MITSLKRKMLITIMFFITVIIAVFLIIVNVLPQQSAYTEAISFLNQKVLPSSSIKPRNDPQLIPPDRSAALTFPKDTMLFHSNLISICMDTSGNMISWHSNREDLYETETIHTLAEAIYKKNKTDGTESGFYYVCRPIESGTMIVLLDNRITFHNLQTVLIISIIAGLLVWILLFILCIFIVNKMTEPITQTFEKQKQFIADAGHELKTPVAVISANADVLLKENGESKWLSYIQTETKRMDSLIKNLMMLAQIDDSDQTFIHTPVNLSQIVLGATLPLESLAFENGTIMEMEVTPDLWINGNKEQLEQLIVIFLSNAMKYGKERGLIRISLIKQHKSILLSVFNTGKGIRPEDKDKIFERFYRVEKERSRQDGHYGLGLAIAQSIVQEHHGKISVDSQYGEFITFTVELPLYSTNK